MPVPDTNTFSLQDVTNAINPTTNDIVDLTIMDLLV